MNTFSDAELHRRSLCSLYDSKEVDLLAGPAEQTFRWALRERHSGKVPSIESLRERFMDGWSSGWSKPEKDSSYWKGPNAARSFGRRVYEFLLKYEVIHPLEPYKLNIEHGIVTGEYALAQWTKTRAASVPLVIDMRLRRPRDTRELYFPVLARWLAAREVVESVDLGIVHIPLVWGERWVTDTINEPLARQWIDAMVKEAADGINVPRVGSQCVTCSHPCKEIFHGPDGRSWN